MKKSLTFWNIFPVLLIMSGVLLLTFRLWIKRKSKGEAEPITPTTVKEESEEEPMTKEARIIQHYKIIRDNLPSNVPDDTAKLLTAQAMHETGNFTSRLYKEQNNLFGMRHPTVRDTLSLEMRNGYATFARLEDSVQDMLLYYKEFNLTPSWKEPAQFVKEIRAKGYFEDNYLPYFNAVRSHLSTVKTLVQ